MTSHPLFYTMKLPSCFLSLLVAVASLAPLSLFAEVGVTVSETKPTGNVLVEVRDKEGKVRTGNMRWWWTFDGSKGRRDVGQIFSISSDSETATLGRLVLRMSSIQAGEKALNAGFTLTVYEYSSAEELSEGPAISVQKGYLPGQLGSYEFLTFELEDVSLQTGKKYAVMLAFDQPSPGRFLNLMSAAERENPGGKGLFFSWGENHGEGLLFSEREANLWFMLLGR